MEAATARGRGSVWEIMPRDVEAAGLAAAEAGAFVAALRSAAGAASGGGGGGGGPDAVCAAVAAARVLRPEHPHALHQLVYYSVYAAWDRAARGPPPYWFPSSFAASSQADDYTIKINTKQTNLGRLMEAFGPKLLGSSYKDPISSFHLFHKFSVEHQEVYWSMVLKEISVKFQQEPKTDDSTAIVWRDEGLDDYPVNRMSLKELHSQVIHVVQGTSSKAVVIPATGGLLEIALRNGDMSWKDFLSCADGRSSIYYPVYQSVDALTNILFSSGTTGEPKAIPWSQLSPMRCAADTWAPQGRAGPGIFDAGVSVLGTVPSLVKSWKAENFTEGLDWSKISNFDGMEI
ncbi:hypothetical protein GUJ93_ZPchr0013g36372 [Zizania palustris]|uniref:AMP-dependent synthetase/ligase domain-containing protein n=1 Tax=Zizania palustris TaxID=103762 RepID=A0A8J5WZ77_ZIZPA|nr:hypothetical protein GUJ93_ZPchr0013g36372 [Zizania palustris]